MLAKMSFLQPDCSEGPWLRRAKHCRGNSRALGTQQRLGVRGAWRLSSLPNFSSQRLQQQRDFPMVSGYPSVIGPQPPR